MFKYEKINRMLETGKAPDEVAKAFKVSKQYVYSVRNKYGKKNVSTPVEKKVKDIKKNNAEVLAKMKARQTVEVKETFSSLFGSATPKQESEPAKFDWSAFEETREDPVNSPPHYTAGGIETIEFIEAKNLGYNLGNAVKYISRAEHKGKYLEDIKKAVWYLNREIAFVESGK